MKKITYFYLLRHCSALGQQPDAGLTQEGEWQAHLLAELLEGENIDYVVSSPYRRAIDSILPFANKRSLTLQSDIRLRERELGVFPSELNWQDALEQTFDRIDLCFRGGESSAQAQKRALASLEEHLNGLSGNIIFVTHGNLLSLLLQYFDASIGFSFWSALKTPDLFQIEGKNGSTSWKRLKLEFSKGT